MTLTQRKKLAKAARELASFYAEGRGPRLDPWNFCGCAAGEVARRAGYSGIEVSSVAIELDATRGFLLSEGTRQLYGLGTHTKKVVPGAVVFPLLWLADELERAP